MIISQTPLRISFLGGGTDFPDFFKKYGGRVLTAAIDKYVYCIVKERFDRQIYINYSEKEIVSNVSEIKHELVREAMRKTGVTEGIEISFLSDIPASGSGLGSSSTVTVGVLNALYQYKGISVGAEKLAREACAIEIKILKRPIGIQDQYIAAYGGIKQFAFDKNGTEIIPLDLSKEVLNDLNNYLMVFFTGRTRKAEGILSEQKKNITDKSKILKKMAKQAEVGTNLLRKGEFEKFGKLLDSGWYLKKQLASKISNSEIDLFYRKALKAGATGGKISGAGGGGFLTLFVPTSKRAAVRKALHNLQEMPVGFSRDGSKIIFNIRR